MAPIATPLLKKDAMFSYCNVNTGGNGGTLIICFSDPRRKYHVKILAVSQAGDGYQTDQTTSTPGCLCKHNSLLFISKILQFKIECLLWNWDMWWRYAFYLHLSAARDQLAASPPPPDHVTVSASNSSAVSLRWSRPAFPSGKAVSYTVRCTPVGTHNASAVRYLQV